MSRVSNRVVFALTTIILVMSAQVAAAKTVIVSEMGGDGLSVTGELLSYDGDTYHLRTSLGDIELDVVGSICAGEACPSFVSDAPFDAFSENLNAQRLPQILNTN